MVKLVLTEEKAAPVILSGAPARPHTPPCVLLSSHPPWTLTQLIPFPSYPPPIF